MSGLPRWFRLGFRLQRWEALAAFGGTLGLLAASLWLTRQLHLLTAAYPRCLDPAVAGAECERYYQQFQGLATFGSLALHASWVAPFAMGLVLGVPLVSREIEHRTAAVAWTLSRSRMRWLAGRLAFVTVLTIVLLSAIAFVSEMLASALAPAQHLATDFTWYGQRGPLIVMRGLAALGLGVAIGALIGRALPGLLVAAFGSALVFTAISLGMDRWNASQAVPQPYGVEHDASALQLGQQVELLDGEVVGDAYLASLDNILIDGDGSLYAQFDPDTGLPDRSSLVGHYRQLVLPGARYPEIIVRESAVNGGAAVLALLVAAGVVRRRRPGA
jgi:hypothetical protein